MNKSPESAGYDACSPVKASEKHPPPARVGPSLTSCRVKKGVQGFGFRDGFDCRELQESGSKDVMTELVPNGHADHGA